MTLALEDIQNSQKGRTPPSVYSLVQMISKAGRLFLKQVWA